MLRLRRVHIRRFRSVAPDTKLEFGPGAVFLLGRNGSGKSTLLDLLGCLISCDFSALRNDEPIDIEWEAEWEKAHLGIHFKFIVAVHDDEPSKQPDGGSEGGVEYLAERLRVVEWALSGSIRMPSFELASNEQRIPAAGSSIPGILSFRLGSKSKPRVSVALRSGTRMRLGQLSPFEAGFFPTMLSDFSESPELQGGELADFAHTLWVSLHRQSVRRFDESLDVFDLITGMSSHERRAEIELTSRQGHTRFFVPWELLRLWLTPEGLSKNRLWSSEDGALPSTSLPSLLMDMLGAAGVEILPRLVEQNEERSRWRGFDVLVHWRGGIKHRHDHLSFGQKRLLAFLWYRSVYSEFPALTDELTNGMHDEWVRKIIDLLDGRQAFHAIQNPLLLNRSGLGQADEIPRDFVFCTVETSEAGRVWRWRNPSAGEARRLRSAWEIGFQQLSEILYSEGLW